MTLEIMLITGGIFITAMGLVIGCCWLLARAVDRDLSKND